MRLHELKCWPNEFDAILAGKKRSDYRRDDRGFDEGDLLLLRKYAPTREEWEAQYPQWPYENEEFSPTFAGVARNDPLGSLMVRVVHKQPGNHFGIPEGYCVLSLSAPIDLRAS